MEWIEIKQCLPPEGELVQTKIDDKDGIKNESQLIRQGNLFFTSDMVMYVYYTPTHWRRIF